MVLGYWCLGIGWGSEVPGHPVHKSLHSPHQEMGFDWVVPTFHGNLPAAMVSSSLLTFKAPVHLSVMSSNVAEYHLGKVKFKQMLPVVFLICSM